MPFDQQWPCTQHSGQNYNLEPENPGSNYSHFAPWSFRPQSFHLHQKSLLPIQELLRSIQKLLRSMKEICKICCRTFCFHVGVRLILNLCQFRVLTNAASSHVRLPLVTVAGHFANVQFANVLKRFANVFSRFTIRDCSVFMPKGGSVIFNQLPDFIL